MRVGREVRIGRALWALEIEPAWIEPEGVIIRMRATEVISVLAALGDLGPGPTSSLYQFFDGEIGLEVRLPGVSSAAVWRAYGPPYRPRRAPTRFTRAEVV